MDLPGLPLRKRLMKNLLCGCTIFDHDHVSALLSDGLLLSQYIRFRDNHVCGKVK